MILALSIVTVRRTSWPRSSQSKLRPSANLRRRLSGWNLARACQSLSTTKEAETDDLGGRERQVAEIALLDLRAPFEGSSRCFAAADLQLDFAARGIPLVDVRRVDAPRQTVLRFVVAVVGNRELNAMKRLLECTHHLEDDVFVVVLLEPGEIEIRRESALTADDHLAQARAALEGESAENAALGQKLQKVCEDDLLFRDHEVAESGFCGVALDLWAREHSA